MDIHKIVHSVLLSRISFQVNIYKDVRIFFYCESSFTAIPKIILEVLVVQNLLHRRETVYNEYICGTINN